MIRVVPMNRPARPIVHRSVRSAQPPAWCPAVFPDTALRAWGRRLRLLSLLLSLVGVGSGCAAFRNYNEEAQGFYQDYRVGRYERAAAAVTKMAEKRDDAPDALIWRLEQGAVLRAAGQYAASNAAFTAAETLINAFDARATVSARDLGSEAGAALTNPNVIPYRGFAYDRIMLNTYKALNYLSLGQFEDARVELRRAYERQQQAVTQFADEIRQTQEETARQSSDTRRVLQDRGVQGQLERQLRETNEFRGYADFVNPFTVYLDALVFLGTGTDNSDLERARVDLERCAGMVGAHPAFAAEAGALARRAGNQPLDPTVYVLVENGVAPTRREVRIDLPLPLPRRDLVMVDAAFPVLRFQRPPFTSLRLSAGGRTLADTELLSSMESIVAAEFKQRLPGLTARTLAATVAKGVAQYQMRKQFGDVGLLAGAIYSIVSTRADLRTWQSLPRDFQFARIAHPGTPSLEISNPQGSDRLTVALPAGELLLVYVKAPSGGALRAQVIKLR